MKLSIQNPTKTPEWPSMPQGHSADSAKLLEELACSGEVTGMNMAMQNAVSYQQAFQQLSITGIGKCFQMITQMDPSSNEDAARIEACQDLMKQLHQMAQDLGPNTPAILNA